MNEPRDSPQRRRQFLVISAIMTILFLHAGLNAGLLAILNIEEGFFPGGEFVYKLMTKDYAASTGALSTVANDLNIVEEELGNGMILEEGETKDTADLLYSIFLDNESSIPGGKTRFAAGALLSKNNQQLKRTLLMKNKDMETKTNDGDGTHSTKTKYEIGNLPKVEAAVANHPFTGGAWSAILQTHKILPKFKRYYEKKQLSGSVIVISTCSAAQSMCTYYMPLGKEGKFYMGKHPTHDYAKRFESATLWEKLGVNFDAAGNIRLGGVNFRKVFKGIRKVFKASASPDEL